MIQIEAISEVNAVQRVSSVPDREFERPTTTDELFDVADLAADILQAVRAHLFEDKTGAWEIVREASDKVLAAHGWIVSGKWIGVHAS